MDKTPIKVYMLNNEQAYTKNKLFKILTHDDTPIEYDLRIKKRQLVNMIDESTHLRYFHTFEQHSNLNRANR